MPKKSLQAQIDELREEVEALRKSRSQVNAKPSRFKVPNLPRVQIVWPKEKRP